MLFIIAGTQILFLVLITKMRNLEFCKMLASLTLPPQLPEPSLTSRGVDFAAPTPSERNGSESVRHTQKERMHNQHEKEGQQMDGNREDLSRNRGNRGNRCPRRMSSNINIYSYQNNYMGIKTQTNLIIRCQVRCILRTRRQKSKRSENSTMKWHT